MLAKLWLNLRHVFGYGYYIKGAEGGVTKRAKTFTEALEWACRGFKGERVDVYLYDGGNRFRWVASLKCAC